MASYIENEGTGCGMVRKLIACAAVAILVVLLSGCGVQSELKEEDMVMNQWRADASLRWSFYNTVLLFAPAFIATIVL